MPPLTSLIALSLALLSSAPSPAGSPLGPPYEEVAPRWVWPALRQGAAARPLESVDSLDEILDEEEAEAAGAAAAMSGAGAGSDAVLQGDDEDELDEHLEEWP